MDYHTTTRCCPHWDDAYWPWPGSILQSWRSQNTFKGQSAHARVCSITHICIGELPYNLVHMVSLTNLKLTIQRTYIPQTNLTLTVQRTNVPQTDWTCTVQRTSMPQTDLTLPIQWASILQTNLTLIIQRTDMPQTNLTSTIHQRKNMPHTDLTCTVQRASMPQTDLTSTVQRKNMPPSNMPSEKSPSGRDAETLLLICLHVAQNKLTIKDIASVLKQCPRILFITNHCSYPRTCIYCRLRHVTAKMNLFFIKSYIQFLSRELRVSFWTFNYALWM